MSVEPVNDGLWRIEHYIGLPLFGLLIVCDITKQGDDGAHSSTSARFDISFCIANVHTMLCLAACQLAAVQYRFGVWFAVFTGVAADDAGGALR